MRWAGGEEKGANVSCQIMTFQVIYTSLPVFWTSAPALNSYLRAWNWQAEQEPRPAVGWAASPLPGRVGSKGETICCKDTRLLPRHDQLRSDPGWHCSSLGNASHGEAALVLRQKIARSSINLNIQPSIPFPACAGVHAASGLYRLTEKQSVCHLYFYL